MSFLNRAKAYCHWVLKGDGVDVTCDATKNACKRFLRELENPKVTYLEVEVERCVNFIENLRHVTGSEFIGTPIKLEEWQIFILVNVFGLHVQNKRNKSALIRKYKTSAIWVARKNGKSTFMSAVGLYLTCLGDAGGQIISAATTKDQARIVFDAAKKIARASPRIS